MYKIKKLEIVDKHDYLNCNEFIACQFKYVLGKSLIVISFFRPAKTGAAFHHNFERILNNVVNAGLKNIWLLEDLNTLGVDWCTLCSKVPMENQLCEILDNFNIFQMNNNPSRNFSTNILDMVLINCPKYFSEVTRHVSMFMTDHYQLEFNIMNGACSNVKIETI